MGVNTHRSRMTLWADYPRFVRRHRAPLAVLISLGAAVGLAWSLQSPPTYSATASVVLAPVPVYASASTTELVPPEVSIDTDAQLLRSPEVLAAVADALGTDAQSAADQLRLAASPNTRVLHVTVTDGSASAAADAANAAVAELVVVRRGVLGALRLAQLRELRLTLSEHEELLVREQARRVVIASHDDVFHEVLELRTALQELEAARRLPVEVVRPAEPPTDADYANTEVPITSGALLGLLAGCLVGAQLDRAQAPAGRQPGAHTPRNAFGPEPGTTTTRHEEHDHAY